MTSPEIRKIFDKEKFTVHRIIRLKCQPPDYLYSITKKDSPPVRARRKSPLVFIRGRWHDKDNFEAVFTCDMVTVDLSL